jgi:hypothetical protein
MSTPQERKMEKLAKLLKARTRHDGTARPGFESNVALLRAQLEQLNNGEL